MPKNPLFWYGAMGIAILGWLYIFLGLFFSVGAGFPRTLWIAVSLLWVVGHPLELLQALPIGKQAGVSKGTTIAKTLVFGITWWLPLKKGVFSQ